MKETDKAIYILSDFKENVLDKIGDMPDDKGIADEWRTKSYNRYVNAFRDKYKANSMKIFANEVADAYKHEVERIWTSRFTNVGMTMSEYVNETAIDEAFKQSGLIALGPMPEDKEAAQEWISKAVEEAGVFMKKFKDNQYAKGLAQKYMDEQEKIWRLRFPVDA